MPLIPKFVASDCYLLIYHFNKPIHSFEMWSVSNAEKKCLKEGNWKTLKVDRITEKQPGSVTLDNIKGKCLAIVQYL